MSDILVLILVACGIYLIKYGLDSYKDYQKYKFNTFSELQNIEKKLKKKENDLKAKEEDINRIINDNTQKSSWLANRFIDYQEIQDKKIVEFLKNKKRPAMKSAQIISEISKEKRMYCYKAKTLQYQFDFLMHMFPMLEEAMEISVPELEEVVEKINNNVTYKDEYDSLKEWLSPDEYMKLSNTEKYQLALDRYLAKPKTNPWQIGIAYERYIGYIYENKNYDVIYNGALEGLKDFGRDIIAENEKEILIIQCKYWKKEKVIHENSIFQLYGTTILKKIELRQKKISKNVKGVFITSTSLSPEAKMVANELGIKVLENENFDKNYPCIKCNINQISKEKIYHLPFDQQYDTIKITPSLGELYVSTVKEAENLGFRRAKKYMFNKKQIKKEV